MTKKIGLVLAGFAAIALIGYGSYALACDGKSCSKTCSQKASNTTSTSTVEANEANWNVLSTVAASSDKPACSSTCGGAKTASSASCAATCGAMNASATTAPTVPTVGGAACTPAEKAACAAQGKTCAGNGTCMSTGAKNASASPAPAMSGCSASEKAACASKGMSCGATCGSKGAKASYSANVYKVENGVKYAVADGKRFVVTANTPYTDVGSARYYFADESCAVKCPGAMSSMASKYNHEAAALATNEANVKVVDGKKYATCCGQEFEVTGNTPVVCIDGQKTYCCSDKCAEAKMNKSM